MSNENQNQEELLDDVDLDSVEPCISFEVLEACVNMQDKALTAVSAVVALIRELEAYKINHVSVEELKSTLCSNFVKGE